MPKCFKCEKEIECAYILLPPADSSESIPHTNDDTWNAPAGAVSFEGGHNFGSTIYDALIDGITVEIIVCDDCLKAAGDDRKKERNKHAKKTHQSGEHHTSQ